MVSFTPEYRFIVTHHIKERKQNSPNTILNIAQQRLGSMPFFISICLLFYKEVLLKK